MTITLEQVRALHPCYEDTQLASYFPKGEARKVTLKALLSLPESDARWLVSRLMNQLDRAAWAMNCAARAKRYAEEAKGSKYAATAATAAARHGAAALRYGDGYAAYAAACDAYDAYDAAATDAAATDAAYAYTDAEHKLAMQDALTFLK